MDHSPSYTTLIKATRLATVVAEELVSATERDRLIVVQSAPVRRLQQKTQVFPLDVKASVRSRLTHSLEVQELARQITKRVLTKITINDVPVEAIFNLVATGALLHDLGNPPFGHFGEQVLRSWLEEMLIPLRDVAISSAPSDQWSMLAADLCHFDGNAQTLRLIHSLQQFNLTAGLIAALCKYPANDDLDHGWRGRSAIFFSERPVIEVVWQQLNMSRGSRHPLTFILEAADDIAYVIADIEDALDRQMLSEYELWQWLIGDVDSASWRVLLPENLTVGELLPHLRQSLQPALIEGVAQCYQNHHDAILNGSHPTPLLYGDTAPLRLFLFIKRVARERLFQRADVESLEIEGYAALRGVLDGYAPLLRLSNQQFTELVEGKNLPQHYWARHLFHRLSRRHLNAYRLAVSSRDLRFACAIEQEFYYRVRLLLDYVSGMTDTYVQAEYRLLMGL